MTKAGEPLSEEELTKAYRTMIRLAALLSVRTARIVASHLPPDAMIGYSLGQEAATLMKYVDDLDDNRWAGRMDETLGVARGALVEKPVTAVHERAGTDEPTAPMRYRDRPLRPARREPGPEQEFPDDDGGGLEMLRNAVKR